MKKRNDTSRGERGGSLWKSRIIGGIVAAVIVLVMFWFMLPPINLTSPVFWRFAVLSLIVFLVCMSVGELRGAAASAGTSEVEIGGVKVHKPNLPSFKRSSRMIKGFLFTIGGIVALMVLASVFGAEIFHAGSYKDLLQKTDGNFTEDVAELSMNQIPVVDRDSSIQLGKRKLGEMSDLVSQFEISEEYTQINYQNRPVRVTPLVYGDLFKWFNNQSEGVPAYIKVDMVIIRDIDTDIDKQQIVANIVKYAHQRGMYIVAEGVETAEELKKVLELEVDLLQGYYLSRPAATPGAINPDALKIIEENRKR